jgi:hypothetical protein
VKKVEKTSATLAQWSEPTLITALLGIEEQDLEPEEDTAARLSEDCQKTYEEFSRLAAVYPDDPYIQEALATAQKRLGLNAEWAQSLSKAAAGFRALGRPAKI